MSKNKSKLKAKLLSTKPSAKAFLQLRKLLSSSNANQIKKEDLKVFLTDNKNKDVWYDCN